MSRILHSKADNAELETDVAARAGNSQPGKDSSRWLPDLATLRPSTAMQM